MQVRSREEILSTLDAKGELDGMPFMPEMFAYCRMKFRVHKRAHKTCDTVFPIRARRVHRTVHLETRCSGDAHGGCQAGCLIFWKEAWLKRVTEEGEVIGLKPTSLTNPSAGCSEINVWNSTQVPVANGSVPAYSCQATRLPYATTKLDWWDLRQYAEDFFSGNVGMWRIVCGTVFSIYYNLSQLGFGLGRPMRWLYDVLHPLWGGSRFPFHWGTIPIGERTPAADLNLQPGELVRVKSHAEILRTLNTEGMNRGLRWDAELVPYCGRTFRVLKRVHRILDEKSGVMQEMKTPCIVLESVACQSRYSECRKFCPRGIYSYWREIWLERVEPAGSTSEVQSGTSQVCSNDFAESQLVEIK